LGFKSKLEVINRYIDDKEMHPFILECLFRSLHDVFGDISFPDARTVFEKLKIDSSNKYYNDLAINLYKFSSKKEFWDALSKEEEDQ